MQWARSLSTPRPLRHRKKILFFISSLRAISNMNPSLIQSNTIDETNFSCIQEVFLFINYFIIIFVLSVSRYNLKYTFSERKRRIDLLKTRPVIPFNIGGFSWLDSVNSVSYWSRPTFPRLGFRVWNRIQSGKSSLDSTKHRGGSQVSIGKKRDG